MAKQIIIAIGDWGNPPHHKTPRVEGRASKGLKIIYNNRDSHEVGLPEIDCSRERKQRLCECGEPIGFRRRYCDKCRVKHRKKSNREAQRKHNKMKRFNISS